MPRVLFPEVGDLSPLDRLGNALHGACEALDEASSRGGPLLGHSKPDAHQERGAGARLKQIGAGVVRDVVGDRESPDGARAFGVDDAVRDAFAVEVGTFLDEW